jgi:hypothetical protein
MLAENGYAGLPWGASEADFRAKGFEIYHDLDISSIRPGYHTYSVTLTDGPIPCLADFSFRDGGLVSVHLRFRPSDFKLMARRLKYRYGRASSEEPDRLIWRGERTNILLLRSSITRDMASAHLMEREELEALSAYQASGERES